MIVSLLVLGAVVLAIAGIVVSFIPRPPVSGLDESGIRTSAQLDDALAIQRSMRIVKLQRRVGNRNYWPYALLCLAFLLQMAALAVDHLAHLSIAAISILPAFCIVLTARAARRRDAQRQLETYLKVASSTQVA
jgi:hypothetical protein